MSSAFLLDTCAFVWLLTGEKRMKKISDKLEKAARKGDLYICPITVWELATKASKGKLLFSLPVAEWIMQAKRKTGILSTTLSDDILYHSTVLPGNFHKDPADRFIVATAMLDHLNLVTGDDKILSWGKKHHVKMEAV